jgi:hypothetical protein
MRIASKSSVVRVLIRVVVSRHVVHIGMLYRLLLRLMTTEQIGKLSHSVGEPRRCVLCLLHFKQFAINFDDHVLETRIIIL